jgi:hypothetical protein
MRNLLLLFLFAPFAHSEDDPHFGVAPESIYIQEKLAQTEGQDGGAIDWAKIQTDIQSRYAGLGPAFTREVERRFRGDIFKTIADLSKQGVSLEDWNSIQKTLSDRFPGYNAEGEYQMLLAIDLKRKKRWSASAAAILRMFRVDGDKVLWTHGNNPNDLIYSVVFEHIDDREVLLECAKWQRRIVADHPTDDADLDTLAGLLYKAGSRQEGLKLEEQAAKLVPGRDGEITANLVKMRAGEPTWSSTAQ